MRSRKRLSRAPLLVVMALVALTLMAVPGNATFAKKYDLKILAVGSTATPSPAVAGSQTAFTATYTNKSIYKINSTVLTVPPNFDVVGHGHDATTTRGTIAPSHRRDQSVSADLNLSLGSSFTISLTASVSVRRRHAAQWTALTKTGNFSGYIILDEQPWQRSEDQRDRLVQRDDRRREVRGLGPVRQPGRRRAAPPGWEFTSTRERLSGGTVIGSHRATVVDGTTSFSVPVGGTYTVCETPQPGWTNTDPVATGCATVEAHSTDAGASLKFGNAQGAVGDSGCPEHQATNPTPTPPAVRGRPLRRPGARRERGRKRLRVGAVHPRDRYG